MSGGEAGGSWDRGQKEKGEESWGEKLNKRLEGQDGDREGLVSAGFGSSEEELWHSMRREM